MPPTHPYPFARQFRLSITKALAEQLMSTLNETDTAPLTLDNIDLVEARAGVYELFSMSDTISTRLYVGKAENNLKRRLTQHFKKLSGRQSIDIRAIHFKCAYVDEDLDSTAPEKMLIKKYGESGTIPWNNNGFGNNDPGRNRDSSRVKKNHFDALYPIDLDYQVFQKPEDIPPSSNALEHLEYIKARLPYLLRFQNPKDNRKAGEELKNTTIDLSTSFSPIYDVDKWLRLIVEALPEGWQATVLPGYAILYRESRVYPSARWTWKKIDGKVKRITGDFQTDPT